MRNAFVMFFALIGATVAFAQNTYTAEVITTQDELHQMGAAPRSYSVVVAGSSNMVRLRVTILKNGVPFAKAWVAVDANRLPRAITAGKLYCGEHVTVLMYRKPIGHSGNSKTGALDWGPDIVGVVL